MKAVLFLLAGLSLSARTAPSAPAELMLASIQSVDSTRNPSIHIEVSGGIFKSIGFAPGDTGFLAMSGRGGTAKGTLRAELSDYPGAGDFTTTAPEPELELRVWPSSGAAVPRYTARGHWVRVIRTADGVLGVQAVR